MGIEIERRFLVKGDSWRTIAGPGHEIRQGYISSTISEWTTRIRILNQEKAWLTIKRPAKHMANHEFEFSIPLEDAESLWNLVNYKIR